MPRKTKYAYPKHILDVADGKKRRAAMRQWRAQYKKDKTLQRIRNLGRIPFCPICQEPVYKKQRLAKQVVFCEADARHQCHYACWRDWAKQTYAETTCPVCRHPYTDLNLKMEVMKYADTYETIGCARVDPEWLGMEDHGGWRYGMSEPFRYEYNTFQVAVFTDKNYDEDKDFGEWEMSDFDNIFYRLDMMSVQGSLPDKSNELHGQEFGNFQKLLGAARRRKPALVQLGMPEMWATQMLQHVYSTLKANVGRVEEITRLVQNGNVARNIAPFNKIHFWAMGCLPPRVLCAVPAKNVVRVIGTVVDAEGEPRKFVLTTKRGAPFAYDVNQCSNTVTLQADDGQCNTVNGALMAKYNTFKIDMGLREGCFRSSDQLETFHLGCVRQDLSEEGPSNPWLAIEWWALVPRTMVTLVFEDGSEGHYAQNEARPDSDDDSDSDDAEKLEGEALDDDFEDGFKEN